MTYKEAHDFLEYKQHIMTLTRENFSDKDIDANGLAILALEKQMFPFETIEWHEIKYRDLTEEEKAYYEEHDDYVPDYMFDCPMPDDGDEILIVTKYGVDKDVASVDFGCFLEGRGDWDDVIAWAYMPKYKGEEKDK